MSPFATRKNYGEIQNRCGTCRPRRHLSSPSLPNAGRPVVPKIGPCHWPLETQTSKPSQWRIWPISPPQFLARPHIQHLFQPPQTHGGILSHPWCIFHQYGAEDLPFTMGSRKAFEENIDTMCTTLTQIFECTIDEAFHTSATNMGHRVFSSLVPKEILDKILHLYGTPSLP